MAEAEGYAAFLTNKAPSAPPSGLVAVGSILERAREAFASASRLEEAMRRQPGDPALEMNWRSRKRLAYRYEAEARQGRLAIDEPGTAG